MRAGSVGEAPDAGAGTPAYSPKLSDVISQPTSGPASRGRNRPVPEPEALAAKGEEQKQVEITKGKLRGVFLEIAREIQQQTTISVAEMQLLVHVLRELIENAIAGNTNSGAVKQILQVALDKIDQSTGVE